MNIPQELYHEIMLNLPYQDIIVLCQTNTIFNKICHDLSLWIQKSQHDPIIVNTLQNYIKLKETQLLVSNMIKLVYHEIENYYTIAYNDISYIELSFQWQDNLFPLLQLKNETKIKNKMNRLSKFADTQIIYITISDKIILDYMLFLTYDTEDEIQETIILTYTELNDLLTKILYYFPSKPKNTFPLLYKDLINTVPSQIQTELGYDIIYNNRLKYWENL